MCSWPPTLNGPGFIRGPIHRIFARSRLPHRSTGSLQDPDYHTDPQDLYRTQSTTQINRISTGPRIPHRSSGSLQDPDHYTDLYDLYRTKNTTRIHRTSILDPDYRTDPQGLYRTHTVTQIHRIPTELRLRLRSTGFLQDPVHYRDP